MGMRHLVRSWHCAVRCALSAVASTSGGQPEVYNHEQMAGAQDTESFGQRAQGLLENENEETRARMDFACDNRRILKSILRHIKARRIDIEFAAETNNYSAPKRGMGDMEGWSGGNGSRY